MSSDKRILASRENGKLGGPKTDEGRARSAANSLKHGLYAKRSPVLSTEDQAKYDEFRAEMLLCHQPFGRQEVQIVEQLIENTWRMDRYEAAQEYFLEIEMSNQASGIAGQNPDGISHDLRMSLALHHCLSTKGSAFREHSRLIQRFQRTQQRLLSELKDLQGPRFNAGAKPARQSPEKSENEPRSAAQSTPPPTPISRTASDRVLWAAVLPSMTLPSYDSIPPEQVMAA